MDREKQHHIKQKKEKNIRPIDFLICNLYPFQKVLETEEAETSSFSIDNTPLLERLIENIDIGGVALLRAASKNFNSVTIVSDPADYKWITERIKKNETLTKTEKLKLAVKAFKQTSNYDSIIFAALERFTVDTERNDSSVHETPDTLNLELKKLFIPRYGENPHQKAAVYTKISSSAGPLLSPQHGLLGMKQLQGKQLSYNNILDSQTAADLASSFDAPAAVLVKHQIPCGAAAGDNMRAVFIKALAGDPISPFGGIFAFNRPVDKSLAQEIAGLFFEVLISPEITPPAMEILSKKKNLRILTGDMESVSGWEFRTSGPLFLMQEADRLEDNVELNYVTERPPSEEELADLLFAYNVSRMVKSNGIVLAKDLATAGIGSGQPNRVAALETALRGKEKTEKAPNEFVLASDGFFPFGDTVTLAAQSGCTAIIQPGGSIRDQESIDEANKHSIAMVFTGRRHFRH